MELKQYSLALETKLRASGISQYSIELKTGIEVS